MTTIISRSNKRAHRESGVSRDLSLQVAPERVDSAELRDTHRWHVQQPVQDTVRTRNHSAGVRTPWQYSRSSVATVPDGVGRTATLPSVTRTTVTPKPSPSHSLIGSRLGSQQQVSVRGRRLTVQKKNEFSKFSFFVITLLSLSVVVAVMLSGMVTQKTFDIKDLARKEATLTNEVETLHRDVQQLQSTAGIVERAGDMGMVVPAQPGVLSVSPDGIATQQLEATSDTRPIIDVNSLSEGAAGLQNSSNSVQTRSPAATPREPQPSETSARAPEDTSARTEGDNSAIVETRAERNVSGNRMNAVPYQNNN